MRQKRRTQAENPRGRQASKRQSMRQEETAGATAAIRQAEEKPGGRNGNPSALARICGKRKQEEKTGNPNAGIRQVTARTRCRVQKR